MDPFTAWVLMIGTMGIAGGFFVLWIAPRIDEKERRKSAQAHPAE